MCISIKYNFELLCRGIVKTAKLVWKKGMPVTSAATEKQTGPAQHATFAMRKPTTWKDVEEVIIQVIGGMFPRDMPANVEIEKTVGDAITAISITLKAMPVNVGTERLIGDVPIVIKIIQRVMPVSVITEKPIGNVIIAIGILQLAMLALNVVKNDLYQH